MTNTPSSNSSNKKRRIRGGIAAIVIAAAGIGGIVAGPLGGTSHAVTSTQGPVRPTSGIFW